MSLSSRILVCHQSMWSREREREGGRGRARAKSRNRLAPMCCYVIHHVCRGLYKRFRIQLSSCKFNSDISTCKGIYVRKDQQIICPQKNGPLQTDQRRPGRRITQPRTRCFAELCISRKSEPAVTAWVKALSHKNRVKPVWSRIVGINPPEMLRLTRSHS